MFAKSSPTSSGQATGRHLHTLVVIFIAIAIALFVGLLDYLFSLVVSYVAGSNIFSMDENEIQQMADIAPIERKEIRDETTPREEDARWYTIHTYAGYENAVERNLKQRIESLGMEGKIFRCHRPDRKEDSCERREAHRRRGKNLSGLYSRANDCR